MLSPSQSVPFSILALEAINELSSSELRVLLRLHSSQCGLGWDLYSASMANLGSSLGYTKKQAIRASDNIISKDLCTKAKTSGLENSYSINLPGFNAKIYESFGEVETLFSVPAWLFTGYWLDGVFVQPIHRSGWSDPELRVFLWLCAMRSKHIDESMTFKVFRAASYKTKDVPLPPLLISRRSIMRGLYGMAGKTSPVDGQPWLIIDNQRKTAEFKLKLRTVSTLAELNKGEVGKLLNEEDHLVHHQNRAPGDVSGVAPDVSGVATDVSGVATDVSGHIYNARKFCDVVFFKGEKTTENTAVHQDAFQVDWGDGRGDGEVEAVKITDAASWITEQQLKAQEFKKGLGMNVDAIKSTHAYKMGLVKKARRLGVGIGIDGGDGVDVGPYLECLYGQRVEERGRVLLSKIKALIDVEYWADVKFSTGKAMTVIGFESAPEGNKALLSDGDSMSIAKLKYDLSHAKDVRIVPACVDHALLKQISVPLVSEEVPNEKHPDEEIDMLIESGSELDEMNQWLESLLQMGREVLFSHPSNSPMLLTDIADGTVHIRKGDYSQDMGLEAFAMLISRDEYVLTIDGVGSLIRRYYNQG